MARILYDHTLNGTTQKEIEKLIINTRRLPADKKIRVLFFEIEKPISLKQHKYWRLICKFVERETGNDANEFHKFIKEKFARTTVMYNNKTFEFVPSMGDMSMAEAADMITKGIQFIEEELGIECPKPDNVPPEFVAKYGNIKDFY
jgi:hypothetical protein